MLAKGLKLIAINMKSLYPSIDEVRCKFKDSDMIVIHETRLDNTHSNNLVNINGFSFYRLDRNSGHNKFNWNQNIKGGGLVMFIGSKY